MKIIVSSTVLILCSIVITCAMPQNSLHSNSIHPKLVPLDNGYEESAKRAIRQVAVNVGPVGVGVGPFGGVGVRVGPWFNLGVAPSYQRAIPLAYPVAVPVAYQAPVPVTYQAAVPVANPGKYSYSSNYRYDYNY